MNHVYVISTPEHFKVGVSSDPVKRLKTLQTGNPATLELHAHIAIEDVCAYSVEKSIHTALEPARCNGEWFKIASLKSAEDMLHSLETTSNLVVYGDGLIPVSQLGKACPENQECIDALDVICTFNSKELFLLKLLKERIDSNNEVYLKKSTFSEGDSRKITSAMKSLINRDLVSRIKREHYMVNPYFLVPHKDKQHDLVNQWKALVNVPVPLSKEQLAKRAHWLKDKGYDSMDEFKSKASHKLIQELNEYLK